LGEDAASGMSWGWAISADAKDKRFFAYRPEASRPKAFQFASEKILGITYHKSVLSPSIEGSNTSPIYAKYELAYCHNLDSFNF
jgi:hypothetical protein